MALLVALLVSACGVSFSEDYDGTETFKGISLAGERTEGSTLTVNLTITNGYPIPVRIACYWEDPDAVTDDQEKLTFQERARKIGETVLPAQPGRRPDDEDLPREALSFSFVAPPPGLYFLACLTPAAADNGLGMTFRIGA